MKRKAVQRLRLPSDKTFPVAQGTSEVRVGNFNGDGLLDVATSNCTSNDVSILFAREDGTFEAAQNFGTNNGPNALAVANFCSSHRR